jgi:hypothetical protein
MMCPEFTTFVKCSKCARKHRKLPPRHMLVLGWRKINKRMECPICTGNKRCLLRILQRSDQTLDRDIADEFEEFLEALGYSPPKELEG